MPKSISDELNSVKDLAKDYAELGIDQLLNNEILREIPIVKTIVGLFDGVMSVRDAIFKRKVRQFFDSSHEHSHEQREKFARKLEDDSKYRRRVIDAILLKLDQLDSMEKTVLFARAFSAFVRGDINFYLFQRYGEIIKAVNVTHLCNFYQAVENEADNENVIYNFLSDQILPLSALGLAELIEPPSQLDQKTPVARGKATCCISTDFGRRFAKVVIRKDDITDEDEEDGDSDSAHLRSRS
jgi:hypothetical protein